MKAKLQKLSANKDSKDSIQFQLREDATDDAKEEIMALRRYDFVTVKYEAEQSSINLDEATQYDLKTFGKHSDDKRVKDLANTITNGASEEDHEVDPVGAERMDEMKEEFDNQLIGFPSFQFQAVNTSISLCVTEKGIITTLTFSVEDPKVFDHVITHKLRNQFVTLSFEAGQNPYTSD